jgi:phosphoribosylaminoimidazolecarboxamide formyltransferase/IMP cyclohydrolase
MNVQRALLSLSDKTGIVELARGLQDAGVEVISTGGTAAVLRAAGLKVRPLELVTGFPELLGGRVKTLHPAIHAGLLARDQPDDLAELARHAIQSIDLVAVTLYPFEDTVAGGAAMPAVMEQIDIGGVTLLRAAAKNWPRVTVLSDPAQYGEVIEAVRRHGAVPEALRLRLAAAAFGRVAAYDTAIASYFQQAVDPGSFPDRLLLAFVKKGDLRYGENPHQRAALYAGPRSAPGDVVAAALLGERVLSFNNVADLNAAWALVQDLPRPAVAVIKHLNPCGAATGATVEEAFTRARDGDPVSAFGGVVAANMPVDLPAARAMGSLFLEAIIAPLFTPDAAAHLRSKKNLRVLAAGEPATAGHRHGFDLRSVAGGLLVQDADVLGRDESRWKVVTERIPTAAEWDDLSFAWAVCAHVKSNAIVFAKHRQVVGVGAGQMSRVDSVRLAASKAGDRARGAVAASDAFFPFADGVDAAAASGITALIQPGGSVRDAEVIDAANRHGLAMVATGERHFRH